MRFIKVVLHYFGLGIVVESPTLGKEDKKEKERKARQQLLLTLAMYVAVFLGVLGENLVSQFNANGNVDWSTFGAARFLIALVITAVIFPSVFHAVFSKSERKRRKAASASERFIQMCVAFQNGFFWPSLIKAVGELI